MTQPTHVVVLERLDCAKCKSTGYVDLGSLEITGKAICPDCRGQSERQIAISLEEFAKLFMWDVHRHKDAEGQWRERRVLRVVKR